MNKNLRYKDIVNFRDNDKNNKFNYFFFLLLYNEKIKFSLKYKIMLFFQKVYVNVKINNKSIINQNKRSIINLTGLAKSDFKNAISNGRINGFKKASW